MSDFDYEEDPTTFENNFYVQEQQLENDLYRYTYKELQ